jgi:hypothetical protein
VATLGDNVCSVHKANGTDALVCGHLNLILEKRTLFNQAMHSVLELGELALVDFYAALDHADNAAVVCVFLCRRFLI